MQGTSGFDTSTSSEYSWQPKKTMHLSQAARPRRISETVTHHHHSPAMQEQNFKREIKKQCTITAALAPKFEMALTNFPSLRISERSVSWTFLKSRRSTLPPQTYIPAPSPILKPYHLRPIQTSRLTFPPPVKPPPRLPRCA